MPYCGSTVWGLRQKQFSFTVGVCGFSPTTSNGSPVGENTSLSFSLSLFLSLSLSLSLSVHLFYFFSSYPICSHSRFLCDLISLIPCILHPFFLHTFYIALSLS